VWRMATEHDWSGNGPTTAKAGSSELSLDRGRGERMGSSLLPPIDPV
jgi:hypothetical protein